jgi:hypothetical protein
VRDGCGVFNANPEGHNQYTGLSKEQLIQKHGELHKAAQEASAKALNGGTSADHRKAAKAQSDLAGIYKHVGNRGKAEAAETLAKAHRRLAKGSTENRAVCANCGDKPCAKCAAKAKELVDNPAVSEAQRRFLNATKGHEWVKEHEFDNKGKLPEKKRKSKRTENMSFWSRLGSLLGIAYNAQGKTCPECGGHMVDGKCEDCGNTEDKEAKTNGPVLEENESHVSDDDPSQNAAVNQPRHSASGLYLPNGSGTGHGDVHESAKSGRSSDTSDNEEDEMTTFNRGSMGDAAIRRAAFARMVDDGDCEESPTCPSNQGGTARKKGEHPSKKESSAEESKRHEGERFSTRQGQREAANPKGERTKYEPSFREAKRNGFKGDKEAWGKLKKSDTTRFSDANRGGRKKASRTRNYLVEAITANIEANDDEQYMLHSMSLPRLRTIAEELGINTSDESGSGSFSSAIEAGREDGEGTFDDEDEFTGKVGKMKAKGSFEGNASRDDDEEYDDDEDDTRNSVLQQLPPDYREALQGLARNTRNEARHIVGQLTSHLRGEQRKMVANQLLQLPLTTLRQMAPAVSHPPIYGALPEPTGNAAVDTDDILVPMTLNFQQKDE